ncbi:MAG: hypothetical protein IPK32_09670 [Verrucomicrobiaceae bacterium]|nr:hypothetical protein [Verrucomicrobiaceae bacterium]
MDVYCSTCGEPWDSWHLYQDAIYETVLPEDEAYEWGRLPRKERLSPRYRAAFQEAGYQFGPTVMHLIRCPGCPDDARANEGRTAIKHAIEEMLDDDLDAIAATFNDHQL